MLVSGGLTARYGDQVQGALTTLYGGLARRGESLADILARQGIDAEEFALDATIALAQNVGVGLEEVTYGAIHAIMGLGPRLTTAPSEPNTP
jgi:hypothetical protein